MYNTRNPAIKRIMQEMREMAADEDPHYHAEAVEADIFEWHFAILGAEDSEFDGGIYHGRIILPSEYPFKPPSFQLLTPSGRFQVLEKICLSMTAHHPEHWQPSWSVRTALTAVRAFMPTPAEGAVGSLDYTAEERRQLAARSKEPPRFGNADRQAVIDRVHATMLDRWRVVASARGARETQGETSGTPAANQTKVNAVEDARMATAVAAAAATEAAVASGASNRERANDNAGGGGRDRDPGLRTRVHADADGARRRQLRRRGEDWEFRLGLRGGRDDRTGGGPDPNDDGNDEDDGGGSEGGTEIEVEANGSRDCGGSSSIEREETKDGDADGGSTAESAEGKTDEPHGAQMTATDSASATETATPTETVTPRGLKRRRRGG